MKAKPASVSPGSNRPSGRQPRPCLTVAARLAIAALLLGLIAGTGCARRYMITLSRGTAIMAKGKPRYDKTNDCYTFTDVRGERQSIPSSRIREIAPASMSSQTTTMPFKIAPAR